jgi:hypothetical protein
LDPGGTRVRLPSGGDGHHADREGRPQRRLRGIPDRESARVDVVQLIGPQAYPAGGASDLNNQV